MSDYKDHPVLKLPVFKSEQFKSFALREVANESTAQNGLQ
jgi:hypothetical protein